jgi:cytochrome c-type biogenesis protein CcmH
MSADLIFGAVIIAMAACVAAVLAWALVRQRAQQNAANPAQANEQVYRAQIRDLDREHESGHISAQEWRAHRDELSLRLIEDTAISNGPVAAIQKPALGSLLGVALALPLCAVGLYMGLGEPRALHPLAVLNPEKMGAQEMAQMAGNLAAKLKTDPQNVQGWAMLGRTYRSLEKLDEAVMAYDRALALTANDDLQLERAEVLAMQQQGRFEGEPWRVIMSILNRDPQHFSALLLAGSASFFDARYADALGYWQKARKQLAADDPEGPGLDEAIATVQKKLSPPMLAMAPVPEPSTPKASGGAGAISAAKNLAASNASVSGQVILSPAFQGKAQPSDVVFVYAMPAHGERMPLAIIKTTAGQLPMSFTLDDSTAMNPERKLSSAGEVRIKARISRTGNAMPQPGDLEGSLESVKVGSKNLRLEINVQTP